MLPDPGVLKENIRVGYRTGGQKPSGSMGRIGEMEERNAKVGPLKKITLILEAGRQPVTMDLTREPVSYNFIYGTGIQGLSPFEFALADKRAGDVLNLHLRGEEIPSFFQHLFIPQLAVLDGVGAFYLRVRVVEVSEPDQREIIKAMAEAAACGDSCCGH
jgi:hypothetical protein